MTDYERDAMNERALKEYSDYLYGQGGPRYWQTLPEGSPEWSDARMKALIEYEKQHPMGMRGLFDYKTDVPPGYDPYTGAKILGEGMRYQFPSDQGLLSYGTDPNEASGWVDESGRYNAPMDYPEHAPRTPEHKQAYNFLRFNNFGGGI